MTVNILISFYEYHLSHYCTSNFSRDIIFPYTVVVWTLLNLVFTLSDRTSAMPTADTAHVQKETIKFYRSSVH